MTVKLKYAGKGTAEGFIYPRLGDRTNIALHSDVICEIRDNGITIFD